MDLSALLIFAGALLIAAGLPGPSVAALVARVIARGWRDVVPFAVAMWIGEALWLTFAVWGLAARARRLLRSPRALRIANRASAAILGSAAAAITAQ